jgi:hypothetical protein
MLRGKNRRCQTGDSGKSTVLRTVTTMMTVFDFGLVTTIRVVPIGLGRHKIRLGVEVANVHKSLMVIFSVSVPAAATVPEFSVDVICLPELLLEESGDVVRNTLEFLIAFSLGSLEPTSYMAPDEWH